jgi:uncharacterized DUF497 family protein
MNRSSVYDFHWDPAKATDERPSHLVTFQQAATVFLDALALTVYDKENKRTARTLVHTRA